MTGFSAGEILATLNRHGVDYILIGGMAAIAHGSRRVTLDVDIVPSPAPDNVRRLAEALRELTDDRRAVDSEFKKLDLGDDFDIARAANLRLDTRYGRLDLVNRPQGFPGYDAVAEAAIEVDVFGESVRVAGVDHLIAMKRAAGRPVDLQDIADIADSPADPPGIDSD